jgi:hypothetical protein
MSSNNLTKQHRTANNTATFTDGDNFNHHHGLHGRGHGREEEKEEEPVLEETSS